MNFYEYQVAAQKTAIYPDVGSNYTYPVLGLCGESGEIAEKIKKLIRDKNGEYTNEDRKSLSKELGDALWYISSICTEFGLSLDQVAIQNLEKLKDRKDRGKLKGSGDNR